MTSGDAFAPREASVTNQVRRSEWRATTRLSKTSEVDRGSETVDFETGRVKPRAVLDVVTTEDAPFWQVQSPFAKEGPGGE